jgi:hypothetical protein
MLRAEPHPTIELGSPETWAELGPLLKKRAELLSSCAADDSVVATGPLTSDSRGPGARIPAAESAR